MAAAAAVVATTLTLAHAPSADAAVSRIAGNDRYETSIAASRATGWTGGAVFLASGVNYADALAAGPVAAAERGNLLLTMPGGIPQNVIDRIAQLRPSEIVIVGGTGSIAAGVEQQAASLAPLVTRIAGSDRVETSMLLLDRMRAMGTVPTDVWVVSGTNFADALTAGAVAARYRHGLVLATAGDDRFRQLIGSRLDGVQAFRIAGGNAAVDSWVQRILYDTGKGIDRIAGANRYLTAVAINRQFTPSTTNARIMLASGESFPDGLSAATVAASQGMPLYLTMRHCMPVSEVRQEMQRLGARDIAVVGGTAVVTNSSANLDACPDVGAIQQELISLVNQQRAAAGVPALGAHGGLMSMAQSWSGQMAAQQSMVHSTTFCNETFAMGFRRCAENIARTGSPSASGVMNAWMNSAGHRANILNANLTHIGVGLVQGSDGRWYWTQNFGGY
ncbi:cell wall-binding repeat-containing protein [Agrococcus jejuensis]|uniref:cell wall-binding repeat-containing protein n=1 Tax=Agrococcus jejuensis TaxID=399736 RepID=UPI0016436648|nr:cell wall-binding repeat-containing protein [Agrococcus jejuensis]